MSRLRRWAAWCDSESQKYRYLSDVLSAQQQKQMTDAANGAKCYICSEVVQAYPNAHHCHSSGKIIGVADTKCNLQARAKRFLPVFFHNLSRYRSHHIVKQLTLLPDEKLSAISRTDEVYLIQPSRDSFRVHVQRRESCSLVQRNQVSGRLSHYVSES